MVSLAPRARPTYRLPPSAYFDPAWYEREQRLVFDHTWCYAGHVSDVAAPGAVLTMGEGDRRVTVTRLDDGDLHAVRGDRRMAVDTWAGIVFVHATPDAAPGLRAWMGDMPAHSGDLPWDDLVLVHHEPIPLRTNWKLYVENHIDWLHLWYLHEETLGMFDHPTGRYGQIGPHWWSAEVHRNGEGSADSGLGSLLPIPGLSDVDARTLRANLLFPNLAYSVSGTNFLLLAVVPTGPETSLLDFRLYGTPGSTLTGETYEQFMLVTHGEDGHACELMQVAMQSARFSVGPIAVEHERSIADFHANLLELLG